MEDIRNDYLSKHTADAAIIKQYDIQKNDLDPITLQRILLELTATNDIYQVYPGKSYGVYLHILNPRFDRTFHEQEVRYTILNLLTSDPGKYTVQEIDQRVREKLPSESQEYNYVINYLLSSGMVRVAYDRMDKSRKVLYTAANCPTCPNVNMEPPPTLIPLPPEPPKTKPADPKKDKINWNLGGT